MSRHSSTDTSLNRLNPWVQANNIIKPKLTKTTPNTNQNRSYEGNSWRAEPQTINKETIVNNHEGNQWNYSESPWISLRLTSNQASCFYEQLVAQNWCRGTQPVLGCQFGIPNHALCNSSSTFVLKRNLRRSSVIRCHISTKWCLIISHKQIIWCLGPSSGRGSAWFWCSPGHPVHLQESQQMDLQSFALPISISACSIHSRRLLPTGHEWDRCLYLGDRLRVRPRVEIY